MKSSLRGYTSKVVHDLLWAMASPHLLSEELGVLPASMSDDVLAQPSTLAWLAALDADPAPLVAFLFQKRRDANSLALGVYYAGLLEYWLRFCPSWRVERLAVGQQLVCNEKHAMQTVGQLKFVFRQEGAQPMHWEASIKYFLLCHGPPYQLEHFVGPHLGENLAWRAIEIERKLSMSKGEAVRRWMASHFELPEASMAPTSYMVLKGALFYPLTTLASTFDVQRIPLCEGLALDHRRGWWTSAPSSDLPRTTSPKHTFAILPKMRWLAPVVAFREGDGSLYLPRDELMGLDRVDLLSVQQLLTHLAAHFDKSENAVLVAEVDASGDEVSRGFVMDPSFDPSPLMANALQYKRRKSKDAAGGREYEQRRGMTGDGVRLKHDVPSAKKRQLHLHDLPSTPAELLMALQSHLVAHSFSYATIKAVLMSYLQAAESMPSRLVDCVIALVQGSDDSKDTLRMGHLVLEAYSAVRTTHEAASALRLETFLHAQLDLRERWWCIRLCAKGMGLLGASADPSSVPVETLQRAVHTLVAAAHPRWNAAAVDLCALYRLPRTDAAVINILSAMLEHADYFNAEAFFDAQVALDSTGERTPRLVSCIATCHSLPTKIARRFGAGLALLSPHRPDEAASEMPLFDAKAHCALLQPAVHRALDAVHLVDTPDAFGALREHLERLVRDGSYHVIGVDCEWRPRQHADETATDNERVQVLQLAVPDAVYILDTMALDAAGSNNGLLLMEELCSVLFGSPSLLLVGFCFAGDVQKLRATYASVMDRVCPYTTNCLELRKLALLRLPTESAAATWGLATYASVCLHLTMEKDQQCSDWSVRPLTLAQIEYAALDAVAVRLLALFFLADVLTLRSENHLTSAPVTMPARLLRRLLIREDRRDLVPFLQESNVVTALTALRLAFTVVDAASVLERSAIVKTVAFAVTSEATAYVAVVLELEKTIDTTALADALGVDAGHLALATDAELLHVFGYPRGCIGPLGLRQQRRIRVVLDANVAAMPTMYCGVGALRRVASLALQEVLALDGTPGVGAVTYLVVCRPTAAT
ncbi:hypothetical protein SDRG_05376 [Saprolegnia diclina VS20]|uniref:3'-5' exonuclease domain-containing protein n=1 Tax=Saprolegnia diclina (strain VS20) TaxID=1156394 RepID=T0QGQ2_SAPDV|nr:hypothetical protein SDRG_05376 [Saprolegnia diclina VS20]EQC37149.1 hypothetical protein SDRG_05376 [Saprolegnia diclina VS20]|eukprot:XP_008609311.1 hypothetical protein SDRG_05376 [Saprolegnia diclina VS20]